MDTDEHRYKMNKLFNNQKLKFRREGNVIYGWAAPVTTKNLYTGEETFLIVARSKTGLKRQLRELCPEVKQTERAFLKVEVKL